jgi:hypothetical protein
MKLARSVFVLLVLASVPATTVMVSACPDTGGTWIETLEFSGSCGSKPLHKIFLVENTVVAVNITVESSTGYASNYVQIQVSADGYTVGVFEPTEYPQEFTLSDIPSRGNWELKASVGFCQANLNTTIEGQIVLKHHVIGTPIPDNQRVIEGQGVKFNMPEYQDVGSYKMDYGDGTDTGWIKETRVEKKYDEPGTYMTRLALKLEDGTETGWGTETELHVVKSQKPDFNPVGSSIGIFLIIITALLALATGGREQTGT